MARPAGLLQGRRMRRTMAAPAAAASPSPSPCPPSSRCSLACLVLQACRHAVVSEQTVCSASATRPGSRLLQGVQRVAPWPRGGWGDPGRLTLVCAGACTQRAQARRCTACIPASSSHGICAAHSSSGRPATRGLARGRPRRCAPRPAQQAACRYPAGHGSALPQGSASSARSAIMPAAPGTQVPARGRS